MASSLKSLSEYKKGKQTDISGKRFAIVVSTYYEEITESLYQAAVDTLLAEGARPEHIFRSDAPGTYELTLSAQYLAAEEHVDAVICLGCVIQGETKHFDFICHAVAQGLTQVSLKYDKPVVFGVLTPNDYQQALDRAGGKHGNKGVEAAAAAIHMSCFRD